jgi:hypothetical protein
MPRSAMLRASYYAIPGYRHAPRWQGKDRRQKYRLASTPKWLPLYETGLPDG